MANWLFQYQVKTEPVLVPAAAETITLDKWFRALVQPIRVRDRRAAVAAGLVYQGEPIAPPAAAPELAWFAPLAEPTRPKDRRVAVTAGPTYQGEPIAAVPEPELGWLRPFSEPARRILARETGGAAAPILVPALAFDWHVALAEPTRRIAKARELPGEAAPVHVPARAFDWWRALDDPTRRVRRVREGWTARNLAPIAAPTLTPARATLADAAVVGAALADRAVVTVTLADWPA